MTCFIRNAAQLINKVQPQSIVDVGCASGELAEKLFYGGLFTAEYCGMDIDANEVQEAKKRLNVVAAKSSFIVGSAYHIPLPDKSCDLALACEILEHLDFPAEAVREIERVTKRYAMVSVPWEPVWRMCNFLRGAYMSRLGNTPGHIQHFSRRKIRALVSERFRIVEERRPFPWTMLLLEKRDL